MAEARGKRVHRLAPEGPPKRGWGRSGVVVGVVLAVFGFLIFTGDVIAPRLEERSRGSWTEATCTITSSRLIGPDEFGPECAANVGYEYYVAGHRYDSVGGVLGRCSSASDFVKRYPVGARVPCYYPPDHITGVTLDRTSGPSPPGGWLALLVALMGLGVAWSSSAASRRRWPTAVSFDRLLPRIRTTGYSGSRTIVAGVLTAGVTALLPTTLEAGRGEGGWFGFGIVVAVALVAHVVFWRRMLAHIGPKLVVSAEPPTLLGEPATIRVELRGLMPVRHVEARLVAREEAFEPYAYHPQLLYRTFFERQVAEAKPSGRTVTLEGTVDIPKGAVPSFHGREIAIRWVVVVEADIAIWPDISHEYELRVDAKAVSSG